MSRAHLTRAAERSADDGSVVLDFNHAYNPPCAFNRDTTCPLPLKENVLVVKVLAGEKAYASIPNSAVTR